MADKKTEDQPKAPQKMLNHQVPSLKCPKDILRKARAYEMRIRKLRRRGERESQAMLRKWNDKIQAVNDAMLEEIEGFKDLHGLGPDLLLDTNQGLFVYSYREEDAGRLVDVPAVPMLEEVSLQGEEYEIDEDLLKDE